MENVYITVFAMVLSAPGVLSNRIVGSFVLFRILHTFFYLTGKQPHRGVVYTIGHVLNVVMLIKVFNQDENDNFVRYSVLLLLKFWLSGSLTSWKRHVTHHSPQFGIAEDGDLEKILGHDSETGNKFGTLARNSGAERMMKSHFEDIHGVSLFLSVVILSKNVLPEPVLANIVLVYLFFKCSETLVVFFKGPNIAKVAFFLVSTMVCFHLIEYSLLDNKSENYEISLKTSNNYFLLMVLCMKTCIIPIVTQVYRIFNFSLVSSDEELANPEKFTNTNIRRSENLEKNDAENVHLFLLAVLMIGVENMPENVVYWFVGSRIAHTLAYLIHVPQPIRFGSYFFGALMVLKSFMILIQ